MSSTSAINSLLSSASSTSSTNTSVSLSNILATVTGSSTVGIDVDGAVTAALYAARAPERIWQAQQTALTSQTTALTAIQTAAQAITADLTSLNSVVGPLSARSVSSTSSAVSATASSGTVTGNHTVTVSNLATTASWYSDLEPGASSALSAGTVTITQGSTSTSIDVGSGVNSLSDLVTAINGKNLGIKASVVTDSAGSRLSLVSATTGSASDFSVTSTATDFAFSRATTGLNASLTVDGVPISSASNTVTGALAGVTLNLLGTTATGAPASLTVQTDATSIATALSKFVTDYNTAIGLVNDQFAYSSSSSSQGVLGSDPTLRSLQTAMYSALSYTNSGSSISSLSSLGISTSSDGTLSLDTTTLGDALSSHPDEVQTFLRGDSLNGFAASFNNTLSAFTTSGSGAFTVELNSLKATNTSLQNQIDDFESGYIANQKTILTAMYSQAEAALQQLPTQLKQLQAELGNNNNS